MTNATPREKMDAGKPHVRFDVGKAVSMKPRRGSRLFRKTCGLIGLVIVALAGTLGATTLEVRNIKVQQRVPWNGLVDVDYELVSDTPELKAMVYAQGYDGDSGHWIPMTALSGDGVNGERTGMGKHRLTWDMPKDTLSLVTTNFTVKLQAFTTRPNYMVVDLSGGKAGNGYRVWYMNDVPEGGWTDEYKTKYLVLRLCRAGTFMMGSQEGELGRQPNEDLHQVVLTEPFYIGVFETTCAQMYYVMGGYYNDRVYGSAVFSRTFPEGDQALCPTLARYDGICGTCSATNWPRSSAVDSATFMSKMRLATGMDFDLPTEAQWEYACRAGTTTSYNDGTDITSTYEQCARLGRLASYSRFYWAKKSSSSYDSAQWYSEQFEGGFGPVGRFAANAWGMFDMHGNAAEICRDQYVAQLGCTVVTNPVGGVSGIVNPVVRTFGTFGGAAANRAAMRWYLPSINSRSFGSVRNGLVSVNYKTKDPWPLCAGDIFPGFRVACRLPK